MSFKATITALFLGSAMFPSALAAAPEGFTQVVRTRAADPECSFSQRETIEAWKLTDPEDGKKACLGWVTAGLTCRPFKEEVFDDLKEVVRKQATTDGQFDSSEQGHWLAAWQLGSSATADRQNFGDKFAFLLDDVRQKPEGQWDQGFKRWYYSYGGDYIVIDWTNGALGTCDQEA